MAMGMGAGGLRIAAAKGVVHGMASLLHGGGGQRGPAGQVADDVDVRLRGLLLFIQPHPAVIVGNQPGSRQIERAVVGFASEGIQQDIGFQELSVTGA